VVNNLIKYRLKGGRFQTPEDLIKIYGMDSGIFKKLLPWIHITPETKSNGTPHREIVFVEINGADSATFEELPGIGPVLAARIIRYRNLLGGFYCIDQIREVYGLHDSLFNRLAGRLKADTSRIRKISINRAPVEELRRHPYIGRFAADGIIRYRHQVQVIHQVNELKMNGIIPIDRYEKLKNYLAD
jgi:competence protein ComEA